MTFSGSSLVRVVGQQRSPGLMPTVGYDLDEVRDRFPAWVLFRSDAGAFYATRRGERLSSKQIGAGLQQTVCADDLPVFLALLRDQEARR
ncbi:hypothetical protein [Microtetraspora glauca]|uniref:Uncharacterized protein n=1 Tax=Microtetraspora glauca TaxID=1996 RepID=A0ABV3GCW9_MICGL